MATTPAAGQLNFGNLLAMGGISMLPGLLSGLFGGDPQSELRKQIRMLMNPANVGKLTNQFYQQGISSPAYSQAQGTIGAGANLASGQLASSLGARGIGTSGVGAILSSLTPSLVGSQMAGLRTGAYQSAQQQAMDSIQQQIKVLLGTQGPSRTSQLFGAGLNAFAPLAQNYLMNKFPQLGPPQQQRAY